MQINRELILLNGVQEISSWARLFQKDLEPWGGSSFFVVGKNWEDGPVTTPILPNKCELCTLLKPLSGEDLIVEDSG